MVAMLVMNDTSFSARSGNPRPMEGETPVEMVSADIRVKVPSCEVTVTYSFRNTGTKKVTATMGFPEEGYDAYLDAENRTWFKSFKSWVDGKPVDALVQKVVDESVDADMGYKVWWVKRVDFAAGQTRTVKNVYVSQPGGDTLPREFFEYIVHTARTWKGPIGKLRLEVDASGLKKGTRYGLMSQPLKSTGDVHAWFWEKFEPSEANNLMVAWPRGDFDYPADMDWKAALGPVVHQAGGSLQE